MLNPLIFRYLSDTNIVIAFFAQEARVLQQLSQASAAFVPSIVLGELYYGAEKSGRAQENIQRIIDFATQSVILACDAETAQEYGRIKNSLRAKRKPLPENDIWMAALALQHGLTLVSRDAHFDEITGLSVVVW